MSAYPVFDPTLPPPLETSPHAPETLFLACPGNVQGWGSAHGRPVFLAMTACRKTNRTKDKPTMMYAKCNLCGFKGFFASAWWARGGTLRKDIVRYYGPGVAVDENNFAL